MPIFNTYPEIGGTTSEDLFLVFDAETGKVKTNKGAPVKSIPTIDLLEALAVTSIPNGFQVLVSGFADENDGGGGVFVYDSTSVEVADGGTIIAPDAGSGRWIRTNDGPLDARWFGAIGDGSTANDAAIVKLVAAGVDQSRPIKFSAPGTYNHINPIDFGFAGLHVIFDDNVVLKCTGASTQCIKIDNGTVSVAYGLTIEGKNWIVEGNAGVSDGLWMRNFVHTKIDCPRVRNVARYAFHIEGAILCEFYNPKCSHNIDTFTTTPIRGFFMKKTAISSQSTACQVYNAIMEGIIGPGVYLEDSANIQFIGGTSEGNYRGVYLASTSSDCNFLNFFMEANRPDGDIYNAGKRNTFTGGAATTGALTPPYDAIKSVTVAATAEMAKFDGIAIYAGEVLAGAIDTIFERVNAGDNIDDAGTRTQFMPTRQAFLTADPFTAWQPGNSETAGLNPLVLNWYQSGTFTPTLGGSGGDGTVSYTTQLGRYTRIGNRVFYDVYILVNVVSVAPSGNLRIKGLPFTISASSVAGSAIGTHSLINTTGGYGTLGSWPIQSTTYMEISESGDAAAQAFLPGSAITNASMFKFSGVYDV